MKTTIATATPAIQAPATPEMWLTPGQVKAVRASIKPETVQALTDYQEEIWDVLCTSCGLELRGSFESGETAPVDAFVRMLIADSRSIREATLRATDEAQRAALRANYAIQNDPLWALDSTGITAIKA